MVGKRISGFTIVELLIVIVVIGILAAITIVAYNGIQDRARASAAQSDAANLVDLLGVAYASNGSYPTDLSTINNGSPLSTADGTTYAYHPGSGNASYCATVTNGKSSYKVADTATTPLKGGCPGDGQGGVAAITNLSTDPSFEASTPVNIYGSAVVSNPTLPDAYSGSRVLRVTRTSTTGIWGPWWDATGTINAGTTYQVGVAIRANNTTPRNLRIEWLNSDKSAIVSSVTLTSFTPTASWKVYGGNATAPTGATFIRLTDYSDGSAGVTTDYVDLDGVIITQGATAYNFADGNTANWIWNGTANNSTSTGPVQ